MPTALEQARVSAPVVPTDGADSNVNIVVVRLLVVASGPGLW